MSHTERAKYPTDLTDQQWQILRKLLPQPSLRGAPRTVCRRAVIDAILYVLRSGCAWRLLPHDFPNWKTVYGVFRNWRNDGTWQKIHDSLRDKLRRREGRNTSPSAGDHRQSIRQDDRGRRPEGLRCRQEDQWSQAAHRSRHARTDLGRCRPSGKYSRLRRGAAGLGNPGPIQGAVQSLEGDLRRQRVWPKQSSGMRERCLRMVAANCPETGEGERICGVAETLDSRANLRLAGAIPTPQQGL